MGMLIVTGIFKAIHDAPSPLLKTLNTPTGVDRKPREVLINRFVSSHVHTDEKYLWKPSFPVFVTDVGIGRKPFCGAS